MPALEKSTYTLYGGAVTLVFDPLATGRAPRYSVSDAKFKTTDVPVRGVTTVLRDILDTPGLMTWPMNMLCERVFGTEGFDEVLGQYKHNWNKALIQPDTSYTEEQLREIMLSGQRAYTEKRDKSADIGTLAHSCVEQIVQGKSAEESVKFVLSGVEVDTSDPTAMENFNDATKLLPKMMDVFHNWWAYVVETYQAKLAFSEKPLYSRKLNYCGTLDLVVEINGRLYVLDFKTTNRSSMAPLGVYPDYFMQLGAYGYALREEHGFGFDDYGIVNVNKSSQLSIVTGSDLGVTMDECERAFAFAVRLHDWLESTKKNLSANKNLRSELLPPV